MRGCGTKFVNKPHSSTYVSDGTPFAMVVHATDKAIQTIKFGPQVLELFVPAIDHLKIFHTERGDLHPPSNTCLSDGTPFAKD